MANKNDAIERLLLGSKKTERQLDDEAAALFEALLLNADHAHASNFTLVAVAALLLNEAHKRTLLEPSELLAVCEACIAPEAGGDNG